jgi:hypothetical protein
VYHSIDLISTRTGKFCGKCQTNILFTQVQQSKIELMDCEVVISDQDKAYVSKADEYDVKFNITTFEETFESTLSTPVGIQIDQDQNKILKWSHLSDPSVTNFENSCEMKGPQVCFPFSMVRLRDASIQV